MKPTIEKLFLGLKFSTPNDKLKALAALNIRISTFSLPAAWTCPGANECRARVGRDGGLVDGPNVKFRCFAASQEAMYVGTRAQRWHNFDMLKPYLNDASRMADIIANSIPKNRTHIRIHVSGDFFNAQYFLAWCMVAKRNPGIVFYAYTKSLRTWVDNRASVPSNLILTASMGGLWDGLIKKHGLRYAQVVFSIEQARALGLEIDHDDSHAFDPTCKAFALLIHNTQPAGSEASRAVVALNGLGSYAHKQEVNQARAKRVDTSL